MMLIWKNITYRIKEFLIYILLLTLILTVLLSLFCLQNLPNQLFKNQIRNDSAFILESQLNNQNYIAKAIFDNNELFVLYPTDLDYGLSGIAKIKNAPISIYFLPDKLFLDYFEANTFGISSDLIKSPNVKVSYTNINLFQKDEEKFIEEVKNIDKTYSNWQQKATIKNTDLKLNYGGVYDFKIKEEVLSGIYLPISQAPSFAKLEPIAGVRFERDINLLTKKEQFAKYEANWQGEYTVFVNFVTIITLCLIAFIILKILGNNSKTLKTLKLLGYKNLGIYSLVQVYFVLILGLIFAILLTVMINFQFLEPFVNTQTKFTNLITPK